MLLTIARCVRDDAVAGSTGTSGGLAGASEKRSEAKRSDCVDVRGSLFVCLFVCLTLKIVVWLVGCLLIVVAVVCLVV